LGYGYALTVGVEGVVVLERQKRTAVVYCDETAWRVGGKLQRLHIANGDCHLWPARAISLPIGQFFQFLTDYNLLP